MVTQTQDRIERMFEVDIYTGAFWLTSKKGVPIFVDIKYNDIIDPTDEEGPKLLAKQVINAIMKMFEKEYKETPAKVYGHPVGQTNSWHIETIGYYDTPTWGGLVYFKCPGKKLPYIEVKYEPGSPETPAICKLLLKQEELQKLPKRQLLLLKDKKQDINVKMPYYIDEQNNILIMPYRTYVEINFSKFGVIVKYKGTVVVDRSHGVYVVFNDIDVF